MIYDFRSEIKYQFQLACEIAEVCIETILHLQAEFLRFYGEIYRCLHIDVPGTSVEHIGFWCKLVSASES